VVFFDFPENGQENLKEAKECLQTAQDFYSAAVILSEQGLYRPAVDSLYSATELAISAQLWVSTSQRFLDEKKKEHTTIDQMYSRDVKGTHPLEFHNTFYNLRTLRDAGRYMKSKFDLGPDKANENLDATKKMIEHAKKLLKLSE
jgi:predicted S18 family serine protease